jgi:hypothetical protein
VASHLRRVSVYGQLMSNWAFAAHAARPRGWLGHSCARLVPVIALWLVCGISTTGCASSLRLSLLAAASRPPSDVALYVDVADAHGRPVVGLQASDFRFYEDGVAASGELADPALAAQHYTLLLIELSSSVLMSDQVGAIRTAAQAWRARVGAHQRVAVYAFDGAKALHEIVSFQAGSPDDRRMLDALRSLEVRDPSTNLNGAVLAGLTELGRGLRAAEAPLRFGTLVVLTEGSDRANRISQRQMLDAVEAAPYRVFTLGIGRELNDSVLSRIGKTGYIRVEDTGAARAAFSELADLILRASQRQYLIRYCASARTGRHKLEVEVDSPEGRGELHYTIDAEGFTGPCDPASPPPPVRTFATARSAASHHSRPDPKTAAHPQSPAESSLPPSAHPAPAPD